MAYYSFVTQDFYDTPWIGSLPEKTGVVKQYDIKTLLEERGVDPGKVSEILVYVFFTGLGTEDNIPTVRAVYELYTVPGKPGSPHFSQFMNAVFNQPDTVVNSANLWIPYTSTGALYARIPDKWMTAPKPGEAPYVIPAAKKVFKSLGAAMEAYTRGEETLFKDLYLLGYRLKE